MKIRVLVFVLAFVFASASAQLVPGPCMGGAHYSVKYGDALYSMFGENWADLIGPDNPKLYDRIHVRKDGMHIVMLYPSRGDVLCVPEHLAHRLKDAIAPVDTLVMEKIPVLVVEAVEAKTVSTPLPFLAKMGMGLTIFLLLLLLMGGWLFRWFVVKRAAEAKEAQEAEEARVLADREAHERAEVEAKARKVEAREYVRRQRELQWELRQDPVRSGPPFVIGGLRPHQIKEVETVMYTLAAEKYAEELGVSSTAVRLKQIGSIEFGSIWGEGEGKYNLPSDQDPWKPRRISFPGIDAYKGTFEYSDGTIQELFCLAGCMNPVRSGVGEVLRGFYFSPKARVGTLELTLERESEPVPSLSGSETIVMPTVETGQSECTALVPSRVMRDVKRNIIMSRFYHRTARRPLILWMPKDVKLGESFIMWRFRLRMF